ncbi:hypothetical protein PF005_g315 [Phytophthora fragariae]|uniref:Uncharacterized protein n=2 Tax=Phytophthora TaxID=4783 RepID=A0A6A3ZK66_9STRA|nr:hypothetical protein PF003_g12532 [Phytophthora fragariae]KAE8991474.1 hypothetical protein PR002_g20839 [Phytophthora rubi]KAE8948750.1 hypothetical protein PF009_g1673 [Phytophthora fragariae]KAE8994653.1 hypothetical protein PR001_g20339 [Phytophthora rubi]KAE9029425.1 hypothetical protein PF011_g1099 [Phytophthora fragariae]
MFASSTPMHLLLSPSLTIPIGSSLSAWCPYHRVLSETVGYNGHGHFIQIIRHLRVLRHDFR